MAKILILTIFASLLGIAFAGQIVNVGETIPAGGTTTTNHTEGTPVPQGTQNDSTGGLPGITMTNSNGDSINVGAANGAITPLGSGGNGSSETGSAGSPQEETAGSSQTGAAGSQSQGQGSSSGKQTPCTLAFILFALGVAVFSARK